MSSFRFGEQRTEHLCDHKKHVSCLAEKDCNDSLRDELDAFVYATHVRWKEMPTHPEDDDFDMLFVCEVLDLLRTESWLHHAILPNQGAISPNSIAYNWNEVTDSAMTATDTMYQQSNLADNPLDANIKKTDCTRDTIISGTKPIVREIKKIGEQLDSLILTEHATAPSEFHAKEGIGDDEPASLNFGKDVITWGNGQVLAIKGDGYKILKALYCSDEKYLTKGELEELVWDKKKLTEESEGRFVKQDTFLQAISRLAEKLESVNFPYRVIKVESETKYEPTGKKFKRGGEKIKPLKPEIIGVRLIPTVNCRNVVSDK